jgi:hypothetical protein
VSGLHRHKWSGAAACAWGAGDTKPGQPALLPRLRCSPLLRVSGSGMHMGGTLSTLFWFFFFFSFYIFYFCGDPKIGYNKSYDHIVTPRRASSSYSLHVHTFIMHVPG